MNMDELIEMLENWQELKDICRKTNVLMGENDCDMVINLIKEHMRTFKR